MNPYRELEAYVEKLVGFPVKGSIPPEEKGDYAFPVGFRLAKEWKVSPEEAARRVAEKVDHPLVERVNVEGGYLNVFFNRRAFLERIWEDALSPHYGSASQEKTYVIDYSSPNIAKPMHVGHLRSTIIGESLKRILRYLGNRAIGLNYLGDIGTQFGALIVAYRRWVDEKRLQEDPIKELLRIYVKFHEEAEKDPSLEEEARREFEKLEKGDPENVALWKKFRELSLKGFERIYRRLGVEFDVIVGESDFVEDAKRIARELLEKGIAVVWEEGEKKGAIVADLEAEGLNHPVLLKSDGTTIYLSRDLASLLWRIREFDPDALLYVVAIEQNLHFRQLFTIAHKMGIDRELVHVSFGMVHVEGMRLSTRRGQVLFLEDILDTAVAHAAEEMKKRGSYSPEDAENIGVSSVIFWMLKTEPKKDVTFRWKEVTSFTGETGPYVQYAYVRARNILEKKSGPISVLDPDDAEWELIKKIARFPLILEESARRYSPHVLARYLLDLATVFHHFYDHNRVIGSPREPFRLWIVRAVENVLGIGQKLLAMRPPRRM
ncbi:MAG: arginine--tRNA ligase [Candidatus Diapherotrites archaeon]|nr:arginine--tRNA ligase [Candidatus Diapherotrites archaeon]